MRYPIIVAAGIAALLGACSQTRWEHPQSGVANANRDLALCSADARERADREPGRASASVPRGPELSSASTSSSTTLFGSTRTEAGPQQAEAGRRQMEDRFARDCMTEKGYREVSK